MILFQIILIVLGVIFGSILTSKTRDWVQETNLVFWQKLCIDLSATFIGAFIAFGVMAFSLNIRTQQSVPNLFLLKISILAGFMFTGLRISCLFLYWLIEFLALRFRRPNT